MRRSVQGIQVALYLLLVLAVVSALFYFLALPGSSKENAGTLVSMAAGGVLMMALYSFTLQLFRPKEYELLFFGVMCLAIFLRFLSIDPGIVSGLFPAIVGMSRKLTALGSCTMMVCHFNFICMLFGSGRYRRLRLAVSILVPVYTAAIFFLGVVDTPPERATTIMVSLFETVAGTVIMLRSGQLRKRPVNILYFITNLWYFVSFFLVSTGTPFMMVPTNYIFIISHMIVLADRYARAIRAVEQSNVTLEVTVAERTAELRDANTQLAASERYLKDMVSNISHDLKTPLTVVGLNLERLTDRSQASTEDEARRYAAIAYNKTLDLQRLTRNLFEAVRVESGKAAYSPGWVKLSALLPEVYRRYADYVESAGITLAIRYSEDGEVWADMEKLWSVFDNTINNALRYTPDGGSISVEAERVGPEAVRLSIVDTGTGIPPEHLPHIFERFYKADPSRSGTSGDSGLGLYIVRTVVEGMGGSVTAGSEPGQGAAIHVTLKAR